MKMKRLTYMIPAAILCIMAGSCVKEKRETIYTNQESKIDQYITGKMYVNGEDGPDTLKVVYRGGANRIVFKEGAGEELRSGGTVSFYYAGYTFSGSKSASGLFTTNHEETATAANWELADADYGLLTLDISSADLIDGLRDGLTGVRSGEHCEILFSGKYGFGKRPFGIVPANTALLFEIWVEAVSNE
ncbi:MAG: FKBP-type peptidyl-prolyl cis-trans isomerase [Bacteroidales bacterium]|nr:FKBP-type peptidyl-prolyl cis-trans isomerase [Bacteroidales bacterium]